MEDPRAILVLRFSSIGDIVLATSPLTTIRQTFPDSRIDFMTLSHFAPLLECHPFTSRIIGIDKNTSINMLKELGRIIDRDYDLVIDLHNSLRSIIIRKQIRNTQTCVYKKPRWKRFKLIQFHKNDFDIGFNQRQLYHECLTPVVDHYSEIPPSKLLISENEKKQVKKWLAGLGIKNDYITVIPSAAWPQKIWSIDGYKSVFNYFLNETELDIVLLGTEHDTICDNITLNHFRVFNLKGETDLRKSLAIISNAQTALGSDTGLMHAAEALNIPAVMIMGPTSAEMGGGTFLPASETISENNLWCRPCSQNGKKPCYRSEQFCMTSISPERVFDSIRNVLALS